MEKKALTPVNESTLAENIIDWKTVLSKLEKIFGKEIFDSWIKNIQLKQEYNHYLVLTVPTRFMRDWVVSRYADKILDIIKEDKKTIERKKKLPYFNYALSKFLFTKISIKCCKMSYEGVKLSLS